MLNGQPISQTAQAMILLKLWRESLHFSAKLWVPVESTFWFPLHDSFHPNFQQGCKYHGSTVVARYTTFCPIRSCCCGFIQKAQVCTSSIHIWGIRIVYILGGLDSATQCQRFLLVKVLNFSKTKILLLTPRASYSFDGSLLLVPCHISKPCGPSNGLLGCFFSNPTWVQLLNKPRSHGSYDLTVLVRFSL